MTWEPLNDFLAAPFVSNVPLSRGLAGFVLFLLLIRLLPEFARKLTLLLTSVALIELATSPFYTFLFVAYSGILYYALFWLQWSPRKTLYCRLLALLTIALFFLLKDAPFLRTPWTGPAVHAFGIAYALFRLLSVISSVGRGLPLPTDPLDYFVYQFFFPTFFQGPVEKLDEFKENLKDPEALDLRDMGSQLIRIACGSLKSWVAARFFTLDWEIYFNPPDTFSYGFLLWGFYAQAIGFYLFVSAANDFTIAGCAIAGYRLHENYDYPYFKRNLTGFWRSWHMTVARFFREEVYVPLGGSRRHLAISLLAVFLSVALWYEASPACVLWGLWHAVGLYLQKRWSVFWQRSPRVDVGILRRMREFTRTWPRSVALFSTLFTFHYVAVGWLFIAGGYPQGLRLVLRIFGISFL